MKDSKNNNMSLPVINGAKAKNKTIANNVKNASY